MSGVGYSLYNRTSESLMLKYTISGEVQNFAGIHPTRPVDFEDAETDGKTRLGIHTQCWLGRELISFVGAPQP